MSQTPPLSEIIEAGVDERLENLVTAIPVSILRWDSIKNTVDIEIAIVNAIEGPDGEPQWFRIKQYGIPVLFPGSGENRMTFPLKVNSQALYIVSSLAIHDYRSYGTSDKLSRVGLNVPASARNNINNHGYVIPGLYFTKDRQPQTSEVDVVISAEDKIRLGGIVGTEPTIKADTFYGDRLTDGGTALSALLDSIIAVLEPLGGPLTTAKQLLDISDYKSTKVEVK